MKITPFINKAIYESHYSTFVTAISRFLGLLIIVLFINSSIASASTGFDLTFGNAGKVISSPDGTESTIGRNMALQSDGKIIMIGDNTTLGNVVARYNSNGSLDTTFGNNGWTSVTFPGTSNSASSVAVQTDGKIVVGGSIFTNTGTAYVSDFTIARFNSDGSLDPTFDGDGKATVSFNPEVIGSVAEGLVSLKIASDGKIVIAGALTFFPQIGRFGVARLNADGSLDTTFGTNGRVFDNLDYYKLMYDMTLLPDGSIAVGGNWGSAGGNGVVVQKYNVNGGLEWTYSRNDGPNSSPNVNGIAAQPDGKLILVGSRNSSGFTFRLNTDGTLDNSFSNISIPGSGILSVAIQPDGKIVGNYSAAGYGTFSLVRYNPNGTLDSSFGSGGTLNVRITTGQEYGRKVLLQPDGKILVGGYSIFSSPERRYFSMTRFQSSAAVTFKPQFDYDGDGKSDISVYRPSNGGWYLNQSTNGFLGVQFGISTDRIVPADYDGDRKTDLAIYRDGVWWIYQSASNSVKAIQFGIAEDKPQSGDFDGDGKDDLVVFRPSTAVWYILRSSDGGFTATQWGLSTDIPQSGDYDGDGRTDLAVFRSSNSVWYIQRSLGGNLFIQFGREGDRPIAADYDGDGRTDIAVWRFYSEEWFILKSSDGQANIRYFDTPGNIPVPADYDGDGKADIAMYWTGNGNWYQQLSMQGSATQNFGLDGDRPTPNAFNP